MKLKSSLSVLLLSAAASAQAVTLDVANQQYAMVGEVKVKGAVTCGPISKSGGDPVVMSNTYTMTFGAYGDAGGTFQITDDNIASEGMIIDGDIYDRKKNKLILKYASAATPTEAAGEMVALVQEKIKDSNSPLAEIPFVIKSYSLTAKVKKNKTTNTELRMTEKLVMAGPYKGCQARVSMVRKAKGPAAVPAI